MKFWTKEQFEAFLACVERPSARAGFSLLFWTGIRIGELLALTLNDFDFEKKTLSVSKSFQSIKGREVITEPKTQKSKRVIPLPDKLCAVVQEYTTRLYDYSSDERLFPFTKSFFHKEMEKACAALRRRENPSARPPAFSRLAAHRDGGSNTSCLRTPRA